MAVDIDSLQIEIEATSSDAAAKIAQLATALTNLKSAAKGGAGLTSVTKQLREIVSSASGASNAGRNISQMVSALKGLSQIKTPKGLSSLANQLDKLKVSVSGANGSEIASAMTALSNGVRAFSSIGNVKISSSIANQLNAIKTAVSGIKWTDGDKIEALANGLRPLSQLGKSQLTTFINQLSKLPSVIEELDKADLDKFATQMERVAQAMAPLATEMQKVANGFSAFPIRIQKIIQSNSGLAKSNTRTAKTFSLLNAGVNLYIFQRFASIASDWVKESNDYVENLNLFTVAMGEYAEEAKAYAEEVQSIMGIDSSEWMRNQGVFMQMASGFGVASDSAALMSKNLTQLGYDISSFYNIGIEDAMQKLQSGLAGEIEPLRRLGYAIDVASLEQVALNHGITESVNAMTQAEKAQLRYVAIMEQSKNAMGDLSRTIQTPANAMRILNQQITQLSRALGNLLIPILQAIIPWVQAFVEVLTEAIQALASLFGFELPTIDYSGMESGIGGVTSGAEDASDALGDAADAAKELNNAVLGIDELNIISPKQDSGGAGGAGGGAAGGGDLGLDLPEYDFLGGLEESVSSIKGFLEGISDEVMAIGAGLAAWKIASSVLGWFDDLKSGKFSKIDKIAAGIGLMVTGFSLEWQGGYDIGYNGPNLQNVLKTAIGAALGVAGSVLVFGSNPLGWTIGIIAALTVAIASITVGYNRRKIDDEINKRFGEIELTVEEAKELAERIMSSPLSIQLDMYVDAKTTATEAIEKYLKSSENFSHLVWKASVGFEVDEAELSNSLDTMIADAQSFLNSQREVYALAINIGFSDERIKSEMATFVNTYFSESSSEMERLGTELKQTMLDAIADGVIDEQEMKTINNLQSEVNQMVSEVADAEYKARINNVVYELGGELSYESVKLVSEDIKEITQEQLNTTEQAHIDALAIIELKYKTDGNYDEYTAAIEDEMKTYFANKAQISATAFEPLVDKFHEAWKPEVDELQRLVSQDITNMMSYSFKESGNYLATGSLIDFVNDIEEGLTTGIDTMNVAPHVRAAMEETLAALEPQTADLEKIASNSRAAGMAVPENIAAGLNDYHMMNLINGNAESIQYMVGYKFSQDPKFIDVLATAEGAGKSLDAKMAEGLLNNIQVVENAAEGTVTIMGDSIGTKTYEITPTLIQNMEDLGVDLSDGLIFSSIAQIAANLPEWKKTLFNAGDSAAASALDGTENRTTADSELWNSTGAQAISYVTSGMEAQVATDSYRWEQAGKDIRSGVANGIGDMAALGWQKATDLLYGFTSKKGIDSHSPSKKFYETGLNIVSGLSNALGNVFNIGVELGQNIINGASTALQRGLQNVTSAAQNIVTSVQKVFNGVSYDPSVNYMEQINEAVASGDLERAAELETIRNAKIDGEGLDWSKTFDFSGLTGGFETVAEEYSTYVGNMSTVSQEFGLSSRNEIEVTLNSFSDALKEAGDNNEKFCNETMTMYKNMAARSNASIQSIISYLNSIPRNITTVHTIITKSVSGGSSKTKSFATGGFPDEGQMFIAREAGPELVGSIGRRTAVANNDQIVDGIASANDGVINAIYAMTQRIVTAIEENGGDIYVEADGTATQNRRNRMYGKTLQHI